MRQTHREQPSQGAHQAEAEPAFDDHGRPVTASRQAALWYRRAQRSADMVGSASALRLAVATDPAFALAIADLDAITGARPRPIRGRPTNWERHHIEVIRSASDRNFNRAADLLREMIAVIGCDPLAMRIVLDLAERTGDTARIDDLTLQSSGCHQPWPGHR